VPLGFCSGGFSSTAGYVPGNEALVLQRERLSTHWADHFPRALLRFYPSNSRSALRLISASLSASAPDVPDSGFPLLLSSNDCVTASVPPSGAGQNARKQFDCEMYSTEVILLVNRKNVFYTHFYWVSCGKGCGKIVDILWISCGKFGKYFTVKFYKNLSILWKTSKKILDLCGF